MSLDSPTTANCCLTRGIPVAIETSLGDGFLADDPAGSAVVSEELTELVDPDTFALPWDTMPGSANRVEQLYQLLVVLVSVVITCQ